MTELLIRNTCQVKPRRGSSRPQQWGPRGRARGWLQPLATLLASLLQTLPAALQHSSLQRPSPYNIQCSVNISHIRFTTRIDAKIILILAIKTKLTHFDKWKISFSFHFFIIWTTWFHLTYFIVIVSCWSAGWMLYLFTNC